MIILTTVYIHIHNHIVTEIFCFNCLSVFILIFKRKKKASKGNYIIFNM